MYCVMRDDMVSNVLKNKLNSDEILTLLDIYQRSYHAMNISTNQKIESFNSEIVNISRMHPVLNDQETWQSIQQFNAKLSSNWRNWQILSIFSSVMDDLYYTYVVTADNKKFLQSRDLGFISDFDNYTVALQNIKAKVSYWRYSINPTYYCIDQILIFLETIEEYGVDQNTPKKYAVVIEKNLENALQTQFKRSIHQIMLEICMLRDWFEIETAKTNTVVIVKVGTETLQQKVKNICKPYPFLGVVVFPP